MLHKNNLSDNIDRDILRTIAEARRLSAFSGAGISAESGIPTFRDPGGIWERFNPDEVGTPQGLLSLLSSRPERFLSFLRESMDSIKRASPNDGHRALFELEKMNILKTVITQNVDNLHSEAGNTDVIEVHGNLYRLRCTSCGEKIKLSKTEFFEKLEEILSGDKIDIQYIISKAPVCECGGMMRIDVVMFGEAVQDMDRAYAVASSTDVLLIVGTSGVVFPAASIPMVARRAGAKIIEVNPTTSGFGEITDWWIKGKSASVLPKLVEELKKYTV